MKVEQLELRGFANLAKTSTETKLSLWVRTSSSVRSLVLADFALQWSINKLTEIAELVFSFTMQ